MNSLNDLLVPNPNALKAEQVKPDRFTILSATDLPDMPEVRYLIDDILPATGLGVVNGCSGVGKSFFCLDLAAAVASGVPWFGHATESSSNVIYVALEGQAGFRGRVKAWELDRGVPFPSRVKFVFDALDLTNLEDPLSLAKLIAEEYGADLVVIDTLNRASPGADENSSRDMGKIIEGATAIRLITKGMVILVHHPGKDVTRGLRGHSSLFAAMDTVIDVYEDGQVIRWKLLKSKDSEHGINHAFRLKVVSIGNNAAGKPRSSCVVEEIEGASVPTKVRSEPTGDNQRAVLAAVRELLMTQRLQSFLETPGWPDGFPAGIPYDQAAGCVKESLGWVGSKHRQSRTKEALDALVRQGYLAARGNLLGLPEPMSESR